MSPRPIALTVLCIIGIIWASLGILSTLTSLAFHFVTFPSTPPAIVAMKKEPLVLVMTFGVGLVAILVGALLLAGSIKSLKVKKSGRALFRAYIIAKLFLSAVAISWAYGYMVPRTLALSMVAGRPAAASFPFNMHIILAISGILSIAFALVMPLYIFLTLRLRKVRDAYEGIYVAQGSFEPLLTP